MTDLRQKLHEIAAPIFEDTPVLFAYLYGSYATGLSHPFSDLDIGIYVEGLDIKASLELELSLALRIDEDLGHTVQTEVRIETRVRTAYFDFLPVIRQYRKSYRERAVQRIGIH